mgnify:FL=1
MRNKIIEEDLKYITRADLPWESLKNKTILISGAAGMLASYMVETLLYINETRQLNIKIIGLVLNAEDALKRFSHYKGNKNLVFISQNVCDKIEINEKIDYIVHAASLATPKVYEKNPVGTLGPNVLGTANLLNLAVQKKVGCFLYFSTTGVYGHVEEKNFPIKEDCFGSFNPFDVSSCYIESKRMGENMCAAWMHQYGVPVKIVRPATTYGPGLKLDDGRAFADFIANVVNHQDIEIYSDGKSMRNFCYLADATVGFFTVMLKGKVGQAYNVATEREISILDLAKLLAEKVFSERNLKVVMKQNASKNFLRVQFTRTVFDISKIKALGWEPKITEEEGFRKTVESYEADTK